MYIRVAKMDDWIKNSDGTYSSSRFYVDDANNVYTGKNVAAGNIYYCYTTNNTNGTVSVLSVYKIDSIGKTLASKINTLKLSRLNSNLNDDGEAIGDDTPVAETGFICSRSNNIDDIPSGTALEIPPNLAEEARTYNLRNVLTATDTSALEARILTLEQTKDYVQYIDVNNINYDDSAETGSQYYVILEYYPISNVTVELNGITYNEESGNDFKVVRDSENQKATIYFDTEQNDDFDISNWKSISTEILLKYKAVIKD